MKKVFALMLLSVILFGCGGNNAEAISLDEAEKIALKEVDGDVLKARKDKDDGITYYDFTIVTDTEKYEVEVNAENGKVLKVEKDDDYVPSQSNTTDQTNQTNQNNTQNTTQITAEKAQEIAMNRVGTGTLVKCELDFDDDTQKYKYEIEIKDGRVEYDLEIDANSGEIIKYEQDQD